MGGAWEVHAMGSGVREGEVAAAQGGHACAHAGKPQRVLASWAKERD